MYSLEFITLDTTDIREITDIFQTLEDELEGHGINSADTIIEEALEEAGLTLFTEVDHEDNAIHISNLSGDVLASIIQD